MDDSIESAGRSVWRWVTGSGYIELWAQQHRAEETLIAAESNEEAVAGALNVELRLQGSNVDGRERLIEHLRRAVGVLSASAGVYLGGAVPTTPGGGTPDDSDLARAVLRRVRSTVNEFRDERRAGLLRSRNQLLKTLFFTGVVMYVLVAFVVGAGAPRSALVAAFTYFLVGAIVGLFNRMYLDAQADNATEDYGLSTARLLHTPLLCGLAALGGVLVIAMLSVPPNTRTPASPAIAVGAIGTTSSPTAGTPGGPPATGPTSVQNERRIPLPGDIYSLEGNAFGLLIAAVFGLTPNLLIARLQRQAEQYKADLRSSEGPAHT